MRSLPVIRVRQGDIMTAASLWKRAFPSKRGYSPLSLRFTAGPKRVFPADRDGEVPEHLKVNVAGKSWLIDELADLRRSYDREGGRFHIRVSGAWMCRNGVWSQIAAFTFQSATAVKASKQNEARPRPQIPIIEATADKFCPKCYSSAYDGKSCPSCRFGDSRRWVE